MNDKQLLSLAAVIGSILLVLDLGLAPILVNYHIEQEKEELHESYEFLGLGYSGEVFTETEYQTIKRYVTASSIRIDHEYIVEKEQVGYIDQYGGLWSYDIFGEYEPVYNIKIFEVYEKATLDVTWLMVFVALNIVVLIGTIFVYGFEEQTDSCNKKEKENEP